MFGPTGLEKGLSFYWLKGAQTYRARGLICQISFQRCA